MPVQTGPKGFSFFVRDMVLDPRREVKLDDGLA